MVVLVVMVAIELLGRHGVADIRRHVLGRVEVRVSVNAGWWLRQLAQSGPEWPPLCSVAACYAAVGTSGPSICCPYCAQHHHLRAFRCHSLLQSKASSAERRASEAESQVLLLGRSLREAEAAVLDWQVSSMQQAHTTHDVSLIRCNVLVCAHNRREPHGCLQSIVVGSNMQHVHAEETVCWWDAAGTGQVVSLQVLGYVDHVLRYVDCCIHVLLVAGSGACTAS